MTTAEVAAYLRLTERTVYDMASKRLIPCSRVTGKLLFPRRMIDRWVEAHTELPSMSDAAPPPIYAGSSDPLLEWALRESGSGLALLTGGSRDGLDKLGRGEATLAGIHLRDPETGEYNLSAVQRECPFPDVAVIHWAVRSQGILVANGNPHGISQIEDLRTRRPRIALRAQGSGSRLLFDALTDDLEIVPEELTVVSDKVVTEADLATMIADGDADCGLGVAAAARRFGLDFVPLDVQEQFDLVMRRRDYLEPPVQKLLAFTRSPEFHRRVESFDGYDVSQLGQVRLNG